jgi:hypothetical protein
MGELNASRLKLNRALHHIEALELSVLEYFAGNWYSQDNSRDVAGNISIKVKIKGRPKDFAVIVGDAVHNLRVALDILACDVVRANGGTTKDVYFPFAKDATSLEEVIKNRFGKASPAAQARMRALQPFAGGNSELRALHDLDIQDKHIELIPEAASVTTPHVRVKADSTGKPVGFDEGKIEMEIVDEPPQVVHVFPNGGPAGGEPVIAKLRSLHATVTSIVHDFEAII